MIRGVLALAVRSLRTGNRATVPYVIRFGLCGFLLMAVYFAYELSRWSGAAGLSLFTQVIFWDAIFISILSATVFSSVISEEKEDGTLGLLRMTGIRTVSLIAGKSAGPLIEGVMLLLVQLPFLLLAVTLGGVSNTQILAAGASLLAFLFLSHGIAVLSSVLSRHNRGAFFLTGSALVLLWIGTAFLHSMATWGARGPWPVWAWMLMENLAEWLAPLNIWLRLEEITGTGFAGPVIGSDVWLSLAAWFLCLFLAWGVFPLAERWAVKAEGSEGSVSRARSGLFRGNPGRCWKNSSFWQGFHFVSGGWVKMRNRFVVIFAILLFIVGLMAWMNELRNFNAEDFAELTLIVALYIGLFQIVFLPAELFHNDVREQTLSSLWMLPCSRLRLCYGKLAGSLATLVPVLTVGVIGLLFTDGILRNLDDVLVEPAGWMMIQSFLFLLHWIAFLSLFLKWPILAVGIGLITYAILEMVVFFIFAVMAFGAGGAGEGVAVLFALLHLGGWIALHPLIGWRLGVLASR